MIRQQPKGKYILMTGVVITLTVIGAFILNAPDRRDAGQKIADAINELPNGVDKAGRQLENRTPGEKLGDAARDVGQDIRKATNQQ
jgi:hypothetical protein